MGVDGLTDPAGEVTGRGVIDLIAELCRATFAATAVALDGALLAAVTCFGLAFGVLAFVVRCTVVFVAVLLAFVVSLAGCVTTAALPVTFFAFAICLAGGGAAVALLTFLLALAIGLIGCSAAVLRPSFFVALGVAYEKSIALCGCSFFHAPSKRKLAIAPVGNLPPRGGTGSPGVGKRQREIMQTWIVTDQKHAVRALGKPMSSTPRSLSLRRWHYGRAIN